MKKTEVQPQKTGQEKKNQSLQSGKTERETSATTRPTTGGSQPSARTTPGTNGLRGLFVDQLKDIYWAEKALSKTIPEMIGKATSRELINALQQQRELTERQITRCERVFDQFHVKATPNTCKAMEGLIQEAKDLMDSTTVGSVRDAGIISAAQKVDHYQIATYGTLSAFARQLGENESAQLLHETLREEKEADQQLTNVAERAINPLAAAL